MHDADGLPAEQIEFIPRADEVVAVVRPADSRGHRVRVGDLQEYLDIVALGSRQRARKPAVRQAEVRRFTRRDRDGFGRYAAEVHRFVEQVDRRADVNGEVGIVSHDGVSRLRGDQVSVAEDHIRCIDAFHENRHGRVFPRVLVEILQVVENVPAHSPHAHVLVDLRIKELVQSLVHPPETGILVGFHRGQGLVIDGVGGEFRQ